MVDHDKIASITHNAAGAVEVAETEFTSNVPGIAAMSRATATSATDGALAVFGEAGAEFGDGGGTDAAQCGEITFGPCHEVGRCDGFRPRSAGLPSSAGRSVSGMAPACRRGPTSVG